MLAFTLRPLSFGRAFESCTASTMELQRKCTARTYTRNVNNRYKFREQFAFSLRRLYDIYYYSWRSWTRTSDLMVNSHALPPSELSAKILIGRGRSLIACGAFRPSNCGFLWRGVSNGILRRPGTHAPYPSHRSIPSRGHFPLCTSRALAFRPTSIGCRSYRRPA